MRDGNGAAMFDLILKQRDDRTGWTEHVAEAHHAECCSRVRSGRRRLEDQFRNTLAGAHDIGRTNGLVGGNQYTSLDVEFLCRAGNHLRTNHIVADSFGDVRLH